jgi:hypothetical protein
MMPDQTRDRLNSSTRPVASDPKSLTSVHS